MEPIATLEDDLAVNEHIFPFVEPPYPPLSALIKFSCESEFARIDAWFTNIDDNTGVPVGTITTVYAGHSFSGTLGSMGFSDINIKLVILNSGTASGHFVMKAYII